MLLLFRAVGKTLLRIEVRGSTIYGRASFKRNGLILSYPMDLLSSIIEIYLPTSREGGGEGGGVYVCKCPGK